jgi:hypothetical protein
MIKSVINEKTSCTIEQDFFNAQDVAEKPTFFIYSVYDVASGTEIIPPTTVIPDGPSYTLELTREQNRIIDKTKKKEKRLVTFEWEYAITKGGTAEYYYTVVNLLRIDPLP